MGTLIDALNELQREHGHLDRPRLEELARRQGVPLYRLQELVSFYPHFRAEAPRRQTVSICRDVACRMASTEAQRAAARALAGDEIEIHEVSCLGRCERAPAAAVGEAPVALTDLPAALAVPPSPSAYYDDSGTPDFACDPYPDDASRYGAVTRWVADGAAPSACLAALDESGLRGMGGAGFPTGRKWSLVRAEPAGRKYVVCNADESEPGTFKDRTILAHLPHLVIEGMVFAGLVVGAEEGIVFIRHEYEPERLRLQAAIDDARARGIVGDDAAGSGRRFELKVVVSPGGYILGEETALLECLEDRRGEPRNKPPYPGQEGLHGRPTLINNVETFAFVPTIVSEGGASWRARGTRGCGGLKLMAVSGDVAQPGVYEIPMGTTVAELIERAGGVRDGKKLLAFAPGGASSNFVAAARADTPIDFDRLAEAGTMLGSGALLVIAEGRDLLAVARDVVAFFRNESCGKCVPCRMGSEKAMVMLDEAVDGRGQRRHLALLDELSDTMAQTSICGLGQVALNPFSSMREAFSEEMAERFGGDDAG